MGDFPTAASVFKMLWRCVVVLRLPPDCLPLRWEVIAHFPGKSSIFLGRFEYFSQADPERVRAVCEAFTRFRADSCGFDLDVNKVGEP